MYRKRDVKLIHISLLLVVLGGVLSFFTKQQGYLHLREGETAIQFVKDDNYVSYLPFTAALLDFEVVLKDTVPVDYVSHLKIEDQHRERVVQISMNRILKHTKSGVRLYQHSYDEDMRGTTLKVVKDKYGTFFVYVGYFLFIISMLQYILRQEKEKSVLKPKANKYAVLLLLPLVPAWCLVEFVQPEKIYAVFSCGRWEFCVALLFGLYGVVKRNYFNRDSLLPYISILIILFCVFMQFLLKWDAQSVMPLSNGADAMQFMAMVIMSGVIIFLAPKNELVPYCLLASGFVLLVQYMAQSESESMHVSPILLSPWLAAHVSVIMASYAMLLIITVNSVVALFSRSKAVDMMLLNKQLIRPALLLLGTGIILGSLWANVSWGGYWNWDPKETWALVTFLLFSVSVHTRSIRILEKPVFYHFTIIIAFLSLLMTYFGVNYLFGGMHSYA